MSSDTTMIAVDNLNKSFAIFNNPRDRLKQLFASAIARLIRKTPKHYFSEFTALNDISFDVKKGETLGIIGHNGSGKSTLLQIICGTMSATRGTVQTQGRIAALLELGSGFNPEFTGRENVYMNGAILGLSHEEIGSRFDSIAAFADIGDFIERPVKTYSSGMMLRLAFAVQCQIDPDILVVDEALAVGDAKFQAKCFDRLRQLKENGTSILLVTHSGDQIVNHCDRALLLHSGQQLMLGEPKDAVNQYLDLLFGREKRLEASSESNLIQGITEEPEQEKEDWVHELSTKEDNYSQRTAYNPSEYRWGDAAACITDFELVDVNEQQSTVFESGQTLRLYLAIRFKLNIVSPILGITIKTKEGVVIFGTNTMNVDGHSFDHEGKAGTSCVISIDLQCVLTHGDYFVSVGIASKQGEDVVPHDRRYDSIHFHVDQTQGILGLANLATEFTLQESTR